MHELILLKDGTQRNITPLVGNLSWSSDIDTLGEELAFDIVANDSRFFAELDLLRVGDQLILINDDNILNYYIVVTDPKNGRFTKSITCFDRAWYLNKNETIIQFKKVSATQAIQKLLDKFGVKHQIANMKTLINKIYKDEVVSDIIGDVLQQVEQETGVKHRLYMDKDTVVIESQNNMLINPMIKLSDNTNAFPVTQTISNPSKEQSIVDLKNKVIVVSDDDESTKIYTEASDEESINKFGLLTEVITVEEKNAAQARNIAKNELKNLNRIAESASVEMLGHDDIKAGRLIDVNEPITGIVGRYLIKSAAHSVNNGIHKVSCELELV